MDFLRKLFGGSQSEKQLANQGDPHGIYLYVQCHNCGTIVRVRADKQHDLLNEDGGFVWHKTVVDSNCFRRMQTVVRFDNHYKPINSEISGGKYVTEADYEASLMQPE